MHYKINDNAKEFFEKLIEYHINNMLSIDERRFYYNISSIILSIIVPIRDKSFINRPIISEEWGTFVSIGGVIEHNANQNK